MSLQDQNVLILGLGHSGLAMARWCVRHGAVVTVADSRKVPPHLETLTTELPSVSFISTPLDATLVSPDLTSIFKSPGLSPLEIAPLIESAHAAGVRIGGELSLFWEALTKLKSELNYEPKLLAVTGTNGKTTVTALCGQLVERAGKSVAVAGNIGPTLLDTLVQHLEAQSLPEVWVLELSSFQLDGIEEFEPTAAAVLNITQDHLDWHGDMQSYAAAKARIFGRAGLMVLNRDDPTVMQMLPPAAKGKPFQAGVVRAHVTFGSGMPEQPGDYGMEQVNGMAWLVRAQEADETRKRKRGEPVEELYIQRLMPADALRIHGRHNATNALAALVLAQAAGCALGPMLYGLREYRGEPHRVESVAIVNGIEYFDDSKGTNVGATVAALSGLVQVGSARKVVIILGGVGKGQDFSPLAQPVASGARAVVLIGIDAPAISAALQSCGIPLISASTMSQAVALATAQAHAGDAVLMSPACASFDMFDNYEHRAREFCASVAEIAHEAGALMEGSA